ncbi:MAG TPA: PP2C family protein-serine/threonine phosphatase [Vicinamibacterales bacterium]|nr:PP2C family protein-serine/threonine phosphatase [Vicinamibacterales bacterium]
MAAAAIESDAFELAELRSERTRIVGLLWALGALGAVSLARIVLAPALGNDVIVTPTFVLLGSAAAYELVVLRLVNARLAIGRPLEPAVWYVSTIVETQIPTVAIIILAGSGFFRPYQALAAPTVLVYLFLITLSTLRLSPALARLTGISAAAGYVAAAACVYTLFERPPEGLEFDPAVHATFAAFILIGGFVAGAVAGEVRKHVAAALREARTRAEKEKLERDLDLARSIQQGLLPSAPPRSERFAVAGWNRPADQTGGDYYDWERLPDGRILVMLADVTGHGVGPALMAAACRAYARALVPLASDLGDAMSRLNDALMNDLPDGKLVTVAAALVEPGADRLQLLSAGHGPLLFYTAADNRIQQFEAHGVPFGVMPGMPYGPPQTLAMEPGDMLILMTDGFFEWENAAGEDFGLDRLETAIRSHAHTAPDEIIRRMHDAVTTFTGGTAQSDDLTAVIVKRVG